MPDIFAHYETIYVSAGDTIDGCTSNEKKELIKYLFNTQKVSLAENEYEENITSLHGKWNRLSKKEEETINEIAKKFR